MVQINITYAKLFFKFNQVIFYCLHLKNAGCFFMNFFKTHQQNFNFSPYYRGVFFVMPKSNVNKV
nr:MAG TPA: hypothetical protein [Bacteriophage sp.]